MKAKRVQIAAGVVLVLGALYFFYDNHKPENVRAPDPTEEALSVSSETSSEKRLAPTRAQAPKDATVESATPQEKESAKSSSFRAVYGGQKKDADYSIERVFSEDDQRSAEDLFNKLVKSPARRKLWEKAQQLYGPSASGKGAAQWVTLGVLFDSSREYGAALGLAIQQANRSPELVMEQIGQNIERIRADPFIYQMTLNLVHHMRIDSGEIGRFYGRELESQISRASGKPDTSFWISTMGIYLAQQSGVKGDELWPFVRRGLASTRLPKEVSREVESSMNFHFP